MNCDQLAICNARLQKLVRNVSLWLWLLPLHWIGPGEVLPFLSNKHLYISGVGCSW